MGMTNDECRMTKEQRVRTGAAHRAGVLRFRHSSCVMRHSALTVLLLTLTSCIEPNIRTVRHREVAAAEPARAEAALRSYGCIDCHVIPGIRGANSFVGPPLTSWAERRYIAGRLPNEPEHLITFLVNPQVVKPGSAMPATGISPEEARDVAAYLYTLR
jgi:mono/diheme cytochrome c family protein